MAVTNDNNTADIDGNGIAVASTTTTTTTTTPPSEHNNNLGALKFMQHGMFSEGNQKTWL